MTTSNVDGYILRETQKAKKLNGVKGIFRMEIINSFQESIEEIPNNIRETILDLFLEASVSDGRENNGLGKNRFSYEEIQGLLNRYNYLIESYGDGDASHVKDFVRNSRPHIISEKFVKSSFELLPKGIQTSLMRKGKVGDKGKGNHFLGYHTEDGITSDKNLNLIKDEFGNPIIERGQPGNKTRGYFVWRCLLEQGGIDPYTGLKLDLNSIDLEHVVAFDNKDNGTPTKEDYLNREHDDNIVICATNVNQIKNNLSMKQFLDNNVLTQQHKTKEEFDLVSETYESANKLSDTTKEKSKSILNGGRIEGFKPNDLLNLFEEEDQKYKKIKELARKVIDNKQDRAKIGSLTCWLGKEIVQAMGLGRGLTSPDGRRSIKLSSDNIYRGFLISMLENIDRQDEYKMEWERARSVGNHPDNRIVGNGQKSMLGYLISKGIISNTVLNHSKLGKVWNNVM